MADFNQSYNAVNLPMAGSAVSAPQLPNTLPSQPIVQNYNPTSVDGSGIGQYVSSALGGSLVGAGLGFVNDMINRAWNANEAEKQRDWQHEQMLEQQRFNLDMWNKNNEYNSPEAQYGRLTELGINPATAIGMMNGGNTNAPASPASAGQGANGVSSGSSVGDLAGVGQQIGLSQAQRTAQNLENNWIPIKNHMDVSRAKADIYQSYKSGQLSEGQLKQLYELLPFVKQKSVADIEMVIAGIDKISSEINRLDKEGLLLDEQTINELHNRKLIDASAYERYNQALKNISDIDVNESNIDLNAKKGLLTDQETRELKEKVFVLQYGNWWRKHGVDPDAPDNMRQLQYISYLYGQGDTKKMLNLQADLYMMMGIGNASRTFFSNFRDAGVVGGLFNMGSGRSTTSVSGKGSQPGKFGETWTKTNSYGW